MKFEVTILGCGSATPTLRRNPSSQVVNARDRLFLLDCGEGTQIQLRRNKIKFQRINHIFISHLHGDHYFGLIGFISTMHLLGRTIELHVYGPPALEDIIHLQLKASQTFLRFPLKFHPIQYDTPEVLYEDELLTIETIILKHGLDCAGFLFKEKIKPHNMIKEKIEEYDIPMEDIPPIKEGADYTLPSGKVVSNAELTRPRPESVSYAYCTDTAFSERVIEQVKGVTLLYHEATFLKEMKDRAKKTFHSTTEQAATVAKEAGVKKLVIGHYSARYKEVDIFETEARQVFPETYLAVEGKSYRIS